MSRKLSRRAFLQRAAASMGALAAGAYLSGGLRARAQTGAPAAVASTAWDEGPVRLGRVCAPSLSVRGGPGADYPEWGRLGMDEVVNVFGQVEGQGLQRHNATWYNVGGGYVYSSFLQPVVEVYNPVEEVGEGFWGQITVPYVDARAGPGEDAPVVRRLYCHSLFRVRERAVSAEGVALGSARYWYRLDSGRAQGAAFWVLAEAVRRILEAEFAPIRPDVRDKRIVVALDEQVLTAYEGDEPVLVQRISSGVRHIERAAGLDYRTRPGSYRVTVKRPSVHMVGGAPDLDYYDLPGVPWVIFFNYTGLAIHGTYWHNDFGRPRSHGCVHVPPSVGQWLYRWTMPVAGYDVSQASAGLFRPGTTIVVR